MSKDTWGCVGNSIRLRSGSYFDLSNPKPGQFTFADIAGALSKICRFGGHVDRFYSVAEHSVHCERIANEDRLSKDACRAVLMHDAAEAFCGDCVKPLKIMLPDYSAVEERIECVISEAFCIDFKAHKVAVREIDRACLIAERRALFSADGQRWTGEETVRPVSVYPCCWRPSNAERVFTNAAIRLGII